MDTKTQQQLGIEVRPVHAQPIMASLSATGQLQLNEDRTWRVGAVTEGKLISLSVHLGDYVKAGHILAEMHSHEVHDSRANRSQAVAELQRSKVLAEQALRVRNRTQRLFDLKAASREQLEAAETQYKSTQLSVSSAETERQKTEQHLTEFLEVPLDDTAPAEPDANADGIPIRSPAAGVVMERLANVGTVVSTGDPVITVSDLSSLWLIAAVNEADLSHIHQGQAVRVSVRAYPERSFPARVFQLGERLDPQTRALQVRVLVSNAQSLLKPDMFATVEFAPERTQSLIHIPESSVQEWRGKAIVFVQTPEGSFLPREVKTGARVDRQFEVMAGLEEGTPVVVNGALLLKSQLSKREAK
ncbi:MAG TPA: efflux RND transporter periplasmic adaptor subunit [Edaphobacter sp.]|nr:efflux RND transporter periplasmic adaptor subunit [Edaphobacter sp.]